MKKLIIILVLVILLVVVGLLIKGCSNGNFSASWMGGNSVVLIGQSTNALPLPVDYLFLNNTTTWTNQSVEPVYVQQSLSTGGIDKVLLYITLVGSQTTSTLSIRQQVSDDETTWYDVTEIATTTTMYGTSTVELTPTVKTITTALTASTTYMTAFDTYNANYNRFLFMTQTDGEDNTGVQGYIKAILIEGIAR